MKGQITSATTPRQYLDALDEPRKSQIKEIDRFIRKTVPKLKPIVMKGILGYGPMHYKTKSGCEGEWFKIGLASNKANISLYVCACNDKGYLAEQYAKQLGKVSCGKSCIRFKKFEDLNQDVLQAVLKEAETCGFGIEVRSA
jgi:Domain of unknown function (DU1801)